MLQKTVSVIVSFLLVTFFFIPSHGQTCGDGSTYKTIRYDSLVIGNGNSSRDFTFPKFNPSLGILMGAKLTSDVKIEYAYTVINGNPNGPTKNYKVRVLRTDDISSPAIPPGSVSVSTQSSPYTVSIPANSSVDYGPAYLHYHIDYDVSNGSLINFLGADQLTFSYETGTSTLVTGALPWQLNFNTVHDTTMFSVIYSFCPDALLPSEKIDLLVKETAFQYLNVSFATAPELPGTQFILEKSYDGSSFSSLKQFPLQITGDYKFAYQESGKNATVFYRVKKISPAGIVSFSDVKTINLSVSSKGSIKVIAGSGTSNENTVLLPRRSNWVIRIYTINGQLVASKKCNNCDQASFSDFSTGAKKVNIIQAVNSETGEQLIKKYLSN